MACAHLKNGVEFLSDHPSVIASVVAYALAPKAALRAWRAVQALPAAQRDEAQEEKHKAMQKKAKFIAFAVFATILGGEYLMISRGSEAVLNGFVASALGFMVFVAVLATLADLSNAVRFAVYRAPTGRAVWMRAPGTTVRWKMFLTFIGSVGVTVASFFYPGSVASFIVSTTLCYRFIGRASQQTITLRGVMLVLLGWISMSMIFSGMIIYYLFTFGSTSAGEDASEPSAPALSPRVDAYLQHLFPSLWAAGPGFLIATCLRFDYSQHLARTADTETPLPVEFVEAPTNKLCKRLAINSEGVLVPNRAPTEFKKPYYFTSFFAWFASQAVVGAGFLIFPVPKEILDTNAFELATLLLSIPVLVVSLLVVATLKGEFRDLWTYKELWGIKREEEVAKVEGDQEAVPAYHDVVKAEEQVSAYAVLDAKA